MTSVVRLLRRFWAFVLPRRGWSGRVRMFRNGRAVWSFPGADGSLLPPVGPWPPEWTPYRVDRTATRIEVKFLDVVSDITGVMATGEDAVRCARCGIHMHVAETKMTTNLDVPSCPWCREIVDNA